MNILAELRRRNALLYWFGLFNLLVGIVCIILQFTDDIKVLGVNRWLKPTKFYFSVGLMAWTLNWLMYYLANTKKVKKYAWLIFVSMLFENGLILLQAIRSTTSHFNFTSKLNIIIFQLMGFWVLVFTVTVFFITVQFFKQKRFNINTTYVWGIRLGLVFFLLFSLEGGVMLGLLKHTIGAADGSEGLPVVNWSRQYGDLRIAHFFGLHSLQVLPLAGCYIAKTKNQLFLYGSLYFIFVLLLFIQAIKGIPLFF
jgi:hypothetical protein